MGLGSVISSIMFLVLAYIIKDIEQSKVCLDYSVFFAGIDGFLDCGKAVKE